jgi:cell division protein FtsL
MIRLSALFWLALVVVSGFAMFKVKYTVQELEEELARVRKQTVAEQQEIRVLNAEWSYLTQPERLTELNRKFLSLSPVQTKQLQHAIDEFPLRPPPPPEIPPLPVVAAVATVAAPAVGAPAVIAPAAITTVAPPASQPIPTTATAAPASPAPERAVASVASSPQPMPPTVTPAVARIPTGAAAAPKVQLAKAQVSKAPRTLNDLFAAIEEGR